MINKYLFYLSFIFLLVVLSCNKINNESTIHRSISNNQDKPKFQVIIEGIFNKNDFIKIYYIDKNDSIFREKSTKKKIILGDDKVQKIIFELPPHIKPKNLMISMSSNKYQKSIFLKNISLKYGNDSISGDGGEFRNYFHENPSIVFNDSTFCYDLVQYDNSYNPVFIANDSLKLLMNKLYPPKIIRK